MSAPGMNAPGVIYRVRHLSELCYAQGVAEARFNLRLRPATWPGQRVLDWRLKIDPLPSRIEETDGPYLTRTTELAIGEGFSRLVVSSSFVVEVTATTQAALDLTEDLALDELRRQALACREIGARAPAIYLFASRLANGEREITDWALGALRQAERQADPGGKAGVLAVARLLSAAIHADFRYLPGATDSETPPLAAFRARAGVCQDFAHVLIMALRGLGIPAAYVSGYLRTEPPPGQPRLVGADAMHAWVAVWCGAEAGWIGIDPTNDCLAGDDHITVAMGRDYADVAPVDGVFLGAAPQSMVVSVDVAPLDPADWPAILPADPSTNQGLA